MRVLMLGPLPATRNRIDGGVAAVMMYLSEALLAHRGINVVGVRAPSSQSSNDPSSDLGFPVYSMATGSMGLVTGYRRQKAALRQIIAAVRPDIIHAHGVDMVGYLATGSGHPSVVTVHGIIGEDARFKAGLSARVRATLISRLVERPTVRRARHLISISPYVSKYYGGMIRGTVHEIPNPVAGRFFDVRPSPQPGRILYAGRIIRRKGIVDLLRAVAELKNFNPRVIIAGAPSDKHYLGELTGEMARLNIAGSVEMRGLLDEEAMLEEFSKAQLLALPSYQETAPMVVQQAMAAGLPVVATSICGVPMQVDDGRTGLLYQPGEVPALTQALARIFSEPQVGVNMGIAGRVKAERLYRASTVAATTIDTYGRIVGKSDSAPLDAVAQPLAS